ncbi:MAG: DUF1592 domain-containing protein, partial [Verrucomicrobiales bacterium]|nr:DUF1592 domain-containing protein [Verrucomicrobiales bacterium]
MAKPLATIKYYLIALFLSGICSSTLAEDQKDHELNWNNQVSLIEANYKKDARPLFAKHCFRCHGEKKKKAQMRLDLFDGRPRDKDLFLLKEILEQLHDHAMPPEDEPQPSEGESETLLQWIKQALATAEKRPQKKDGSSRRLTVAQYRNTLRELLGIDDDLTKILPPDSVSKNGFLNNEQTMLLTPHLIESYFGIAEKALAIAIVDEDSKPIIQNFKVILGSNINPQSHKDKLILNGGRILPNQDLKITQQTPIKSFPFTPFRMKDEFDFIEGYKGNGTVRGWRNFKGIHHAIFGVMIGSGGGFKQKNSYQMVKEGLLLRPALPGIYSNWSPGQPLPWGLAPTLSIPVRELPKNGDFRITVEAARHLDVIEEGDKNNVGNRYPKLGAYLGIRRDCGITFTQIEEPKAVLSDDLNKYIFEGPMSGFPSSDLEKGNANYLAGLHEIGIRSEFTDDREMPRLLVHSIEFEGPYYENWPPYSHRNIFIKSKAKEGSEEYADDIIKHFLERAFRRPPTNEEITMMNKVWNDSFSKTKNFQDSIKDTLMVILTSPQFLFLIEESQGPQAEPVHSFELASKLSYFLWNGPPDKDLLDLASQKKLTASIKSQTERMVRDQRFNRFTERFVSEWLGLEKFDVVEVDHSRFPKLTTSMKKQLRKEPIETVKYLFQKNLPLKKLVRSDFILANEMVASYYGLGDKTESGFEFVSLQHDSTSLGGILTQAAILAGLSDGRESNPIKRGAWLARKIIAEPPDDPPPNVPELPEDNETKLTLREKLEQHRNQKGCMECHAKIDPWGLPLEEYDAGGLFKQKKIVDAQSTLP